MKSICDKITASTNKINSTDLEIITDKMYHKIEDINIFFNISLQIVKKILRSGTNSEYIKNIVKKIESDDFSSNLESNSLEIFLVN
jgi:hypothetical protein